MKGSDWIEAFFVFIVWGGQFLCYGALGAYILFTILRSHRRRTALKDGRVLEALARELGGEVDRRRHEFPFIRFRRGETPCFFIQWAIGSADVRVSTLEACIGSEGFFEATSRDSRRVLSRFPRAFELQALADFRIVTTDRAWAERLLRDGLRDTLFEFRAWAKAPVRIQLTPGRLTVEVEGLTADKNLLGFFDRVVAFIHAPDEPDGVKVISTAFDPSRGRCPVCGLGTKVPLRLCDACRAPHHPDCWSYVGRCGIFGCGGR